ncbi:hypothetical protein MN116_003140 [Schistosoma mekongi]|uniref:Major facilitator superfamily (MFS) profile domain-containing protein n=1 Tax=Schistosoma mekongi TaxID=38744 RepID=A0AAE1ZGY2_SCHME|nr:hypothetical protein MN116_003140 [Schistosoma mekongi]
MTKEEATSQLTQSIFHTIYAHFSRARLKLYGWRHLGWLVLLVAALNVVCIGGKRRAFGIFVAALHKAYNDTSMTELNWVGDSYAAVGFFLMPFATTAIIRLNRPYRFTMLLAGLLIFVSCMTSAAVPSPGYLFLTHTLIHGLGSTLILCGTSLVTGEYFDKSHRFHVLATAFVSGGPYGVLIFGPLYSNLIQNYGWQVAFQLSGLLFLFVTCLAGIVFISRDMFEYHQAISETFEASEENSLDQSLRRDSLLLRNSPKASDGRGWAFCSFEHLKNNPQVFVWGFERLLHNLVIYGLLMNMTAYVSQALNDQLVLGARVNLYFGIGESVVFTVGALIGDRIRGYLAFVYFIGASFAALFLLIMQNTYEDINVVYVLAGFTGATVGVGNTFLYATSEEIMLVHGSIAFPMTKMIAGIGMLLAPLFSGAIIDGFGYGGFFISMAVLVSIRVILLGLICYILHRKKKFIIDTEKQHVFTNENNLYHCCKNTNKPCNDKITELTKTDNIKSEVKNGLYFDSKVNDLEKRIQISSEWYHENDRRIP